MGQDITSSLLDSDKTKKQNESQEEEKEQNEQKFLTTHGNIVENKVSNYSKGSMFSINSEYNN